MTAHTNSTTGTERDLLRCSIVIIVARAINHLVSGSREEQDKELQSWLGQGDRGRGARGSRQGRLQRGEEGYLHLSGEHR